MGVPSERYQRYKEEAEHYIKLMVEEGPNADKTESEVQSDVYGIIINALNGLHSWVEKVK